MDVIAYCKCQETLTWQQLINGVWTDRPGHWTASGDTGWDYTPADALSQAAVTTWRYCCDDVCVPAMQVNYSGGTGGNNDVVTISLTKAADHSGISSPAQVGETITYSFTVINTGNVTLSNVTVTDPLVAVTGGPISLPAGTADANTFTATYAITQADIDSGSIVNTATVSGDYNGQVASSTSVVTCPLDNTVVPCSPEVTLPDEYLIPPEPCVVETQPVSWSGNAGELIDIGGSCDSCTGNYQMLVNGVWVNMVDPNGVAADPSYDGQWRICCSAGTSYSDPVTISVACVNDVPVFNQQPPYTITVNLNDTIPDQNFACCNSGDFFPQVWDDSDPFNTGYTATGPNNFPTQATCQWTYTFNGVTKTIDLNGSQWRICCPDGCSDDNSLANAITIEIVGCP